MLSKSKSFHEMSSLYPVQNNEAIILKKFAKDATILSKIYRCIINT